MRMHPGVSFPLERVVPAGGVQVSGAFLPEGTIVGMTAAVVHRDKEVFGEDADTYRPERWLGEEEGVKVMERTLLTVRHHIIASAALKMEPTDKWLVWSWGQDLHRKEYFHHGDGQVCTPSASRI
jgi:hypothetical protein